MDFRDYLNKKIIAISVPIQQVDDIDNIISKAKKNISSHESNTIKSNIDESIIRAVKILESLPDPTIEDQNKVLNKNNQSKFNDDIMRAISILK
jgi:hypothetical protein